MENRAWEEVKKLLDKWVGYCEKATDDGKYIEDKTANAGYNEYNRFAKWMDDHCPGYFNKVANKSWIGWCTVIMPWSICETFGEDAAAKFFRIPGKGAKNLQLSVGMTANYFKGAKEYYPRAGFDPQAGDIIFFDSTEQGGFAHVGWVYGRADNGKVITFEGNTGRTADLPYCGGCTAIKQYWTYDKRITGYARPDWSMLNALLDAAPAPAPAPELAPTPAPEASEDVKRGDKGAKVTELQRKLMGLGYKLPRYGADGDFGAETESALKAYQKDIGASVTGVYDGQTRAAEKARDGSLAADLTGIARTLHFGCQGKDVELLQKAMVKLGSDTADDDGAGIFGFAMMRAVGEFQMELGQNVNGIADKDLIGEVAKAVDK